MVFLVVMYGCESWTIKKAEGRRIDGFKLWCWRRLLAIPWTARRSNQSILKEINPAYSLEGLMLKLKLQYFGHMMWRADSLEKTLMLGKIEGRRRRGQQRMRWLVVAYLKHCSPTGTFPPGKPNDRSKCDLGLKDNSQKLQREEIIYTAKWISHYSRYARRSQGRLCIDLQVFNKELKDQFGSYRTGCHGEASLETLFSVTAGSNANGLLGWLIHTLA